MMVLLVQAFLLLLGAFLLGASLACLLRRAFAGREETPHLAAASPGLTAAAAPAPWVGDVSSLKTDRFGRALMGAGRAVPPVFREAYSGPVVEVQEPPVAERAQRPRQEPVSSPPAEPPAAVVPPPPAPAPAPAPPRPVLQVVPTAPPAPVVESRPPPPAPAAHAEPRPAAPEPPPAEPPKSVESTAAESGLKRAAERSYAEIAVAAAAAAAAAKAVADREAAEKAKAEAERKAARAAREAAEAPAPEPRGISSVPLVMPPPAEPTAPVEAVPSDRFGSGSAAEQPLDDLCRIRAIDPELKAHLHRYGIRTFAQIAAWTPEDAREAGEVLAIGAQISDENWVEQARILAEGGDVTPLRPRERTAEEIAVPVDPERLHRIVGIDPETEAQLNATGITRLSQIARWSDADVTTFEGLLGLEAGRIAGEGWVEQARFLTRALREEDADAVPLTGEPETRVQDAEVSRPLAVVDDEIEAADEPSLSEEVSEDDQDGEEGQTGARDGLTGLRSVRSEALRGSSVPPGAVDDLKRIRGIGVLIEKKLNSLGITAYEQVANWTDADIDRISQLLDFGGRIERENWIEQARILASGGQTEFSRRVDRGEA